MSAYDDALAAYLGGLPNGSLWGDSAPNAHHGDLFGAAAWAEDSGGIDRHYVNCVNYLTPDYAAASFGGDPGLTDFSVACWILPAADGSNTIRTMLYGGDPVTGGVGDSWWLFGNSDTATSATQWTSVRFWFGGERTDVLGLSMPVGQWAHVAATRTAAGATELFLNGTSIGTGSMPTNPPSVGICCAVNKTYQTNGGWADVGIWKRILTSAEITQISDPTFQPLGGGTGAYNPFRKPYVFGA